jgi:hypothetical protein
LLVPRGASTTGCSMPGRKEAMMQDFALLEEAKGRYADRIRDADAFRRVLRSGKVVKSSPILKTLIIFLISVL